MSNDKSSDKQQPSLSEAWKCIIEWLENEDKGGDPDDLYTGRAHRVAEIKGMLRSRALLSDALLSASSPVAPRDEQSLPSTSDKDWKGPYVAPSCSGDLPSRSNVAPIKFVVEFIDASGTIEDGYQDHGSCFAVYAEREGFTDEENHVADFGDEASAEKCATALNRLGCPEQIGHVTPGHGSQDMASDRSSAEAARQSGGGLPPTPAPSSEPLGTGETPRTDANAMPARNWGDRVDLVPANLSREFERDLTISNWKIDALYLEIDRLNAARSATLPRNADPHQECYWTWQYDDGSMHTDLHMTEKYCREEAEEEELTDPSVGKLTVIRVRVVLDSTGGQK